MLHSVIRKKYGAWLPTGDYGTVHHHFRQGILQGSEQEVHEVKKRLNQQALREVCSRAYSGIYIYLVCWTVIALWTGVVFSHTRFTLTVGGIWLVLAVLRFVLHMRLEKAMEANFQLTRLIFITLLLANGLVLGVVTGISTQWPPLLVGQTPLLVTAAALCASVSLGLSIDNFIRMGMPVAILLPFTLSLFIDRQVTANDWMMCFLVAIFVIYLIIASKRIHYDYWSALLSRHMLDVRAKELEKLSNTDTLTQLPNRHHFERRLAENWELSQRLNGLMTVMMLDIDHFKKINDSYGHPVGDECLVKVAQTLKDMCQRETDMVARYGGEEFILALPASSPEYARDFAERLREQVARLQFNAKGVDFIITCSIGVATVNPHMLLGPQMKAISLADRALYQAKSEGRNRVVQTLVLHQDHRLLDSQEDASIIKV